MTSLFAIRPASQGDIPLLTTLIERSIRALGAHDYSREQIDGALRSAFGIDTQLIRDQTYFVVEADGVLAACGGWSKRKTLFGSDSRVDRDGSELDPQSDAAKIRAFFVSPDFARMGLGRLLLAHCESEAKLHGFRRCELMATLPGVRLYSACGYEAGETIQHLLGDGLSIAFVPMMKSLA